VAAVLARRRVPLLAAALVLVVAVVALVLLLRGGDDKGAATRGEPLAYVPAGAREAVFDLDTGAPLVSVAVEQLAPRLTGGGVTPAQVRPLLGGRAAIAMQGGRTWLVFATDAEAPRVGSGAAVAKRGGIVVIGRTAADVRAALAAGAAPAARYARATFDRRFAGMPRGSVRVAFDPRQQLALRAAPLANTRWGRSLRDGAAVLMTEGSELRVPFKITADPVGLTPDDLPVAAGPQAPQARGRAPLTVGIRDPARTLRFARDIGLFPELDLVDQLPGFLKPNLNDLGPSGTVTASSLSDLEHLTLRTEPPNPGDWSSKLGRIDALSGLAKRAGIVDIDIDHRDGVYTLTQKGKLVARVGVFGKALVLSSDPRADLRAAANAPPAPVPGAAGGLTARLAAASFLPQLPPLLSTRLGDVTGWARTELTGVSGQLRLVLR
jgi:hypothetical protein